MATKINGTAAGGTAAGNDSSAKLRTWLELLDAADDLEALLNEAGGHGVPATTRGAVADALARLRLDLMNARPRR